MAIVEHLGDVENKVFGRLIAEAGDNFVVDIERDWQVLIAEADVTRTSLPPIK
jgi:hypothetical protein